VIAYYLLRNIDLEDMMFGSINEACCNNNRAPKIRGNVLNDNAIARSWSVSLHTASKAERMYLGSLVTNPECLAKMSL
jgi:hypothetical protein